jgi:DtxR family Mn-dependent transcriptional regulator
MRHYAAELFRLQENYSFVPLSALAKALSVSLQAASRMVRRLQKANLVVHVPYQGLRLTAEGESQALPAIRRHRLTEVFLVQVMGFGWDEVHDLTDHLEPGINDALEQRIDEILDHPTRCPHGEPIPDRDGRLPTLDDAPLTTIAPGVTARVSRIRTHDAAQLRYVGELGLKPGKPFHLLSTAPFDGPLRINLGTEELVLGFNLASTIWVESEAQ